MPLADIRNFLAIAERLGTAGQPTEAQLVEIRDAGYAAVINLGLLIPGTACPTRPAPWRSST